MDIEQILYQALDAPEVKAAISGDVYKLNRPLDSRKVDITVGCLPVNNLQLQTAVANVNVHAPNLVFSHGGVQDNTQADFATLRLVTELVISKLEGYTDKYSYEVQQQHMFADREINEHYVNIRVNFYNINL